MKVHEKTNGMDVKTNVLVLIADSFEEERILAAIKNCIKNGGSLEIAIPIMGEDERVVKCNFQVKNKDEDEEND
jgi:hypothetical protein